MKRRSFIAVFLTGLLGASGILFTGWLRNSNRKEEIIAQPKFLSTLCDDGTIRKLGDAYLKLKPNEGNRLVEDFATSNLSVEKKETLAAVESQIEKNIIHDFDTNNVVVVQGWVLSVTEARQCAFFATHN